jgi:hypothetical protein
MQHGSRPVATWTPMTNEEAEVLAVKVWDIEVTWRSAEA